MTKQHPSNSPRQVPVPLRSAFERTEHPFLVWEQIQRIPEEIASYAQPSVLEEAREAARILKEASVVHAIGCGTSLFAGYVAPYLFASSDRVVAVHEAFAFQRLAGSLPPTSAVLAISHTGGTAAVLDASTRAQRRGLQVVGLTDDVHSPLARQADAAVIGRLGPEPCLPKSRSYVGTIVKEYLLAATLAEELQAASACQPLGRTAFQAAREMVTRLAEQASELLQRASVDGRDVARTFTSELIPDPASGVSRRIWVIGSGPNAATAFEAALKLQEIAQEPALGFELEEVMHGPWVMMNPGDLVIVIRVEGDAKGKMDRFCEALATLGVRIWDLSTESDRPEWATHCTTLPRFSEVLTPVLSILPAYVFAYEYALARGLRPDSMRLTDERYLQARVRLPR